MKPYDQLTRRQQFFRKNIARVIIYGAFAFVLFWSMSKMVALEEEKQAQYSRIENTMMEYYKKTKMQTDTVGMSDYMRERLSHDDFNAWKEHALQ